MHYNIRQQPIIFTTELVKDVLRARAIRKEIERREQIIRDIDEQNNATLEEIRKIKLEILRRDEIKKVIENRQKIIDRVKEEMNGKTIPTVDAPTKNVKSKKSIRSKTKKPKRKLSLEDQWERREFRAIMNSLRS
ncbi:nuclear pore complex protein Nup85 [Acrasis kona]|uniref:Nuclear pore complex protein Nup85 n=1 Tax=Acrasis kona TaxID=1008807 RepID=A0AAW2YXQ8_9EUKA